MRGCRFWRWAPAAAGSALLWQVAGCGARGFIDEDDLIDTEVVAAAGSSSSLGGSSGTGDSGALGGSGGGGGSSSFGGSSGSGGAGGSATPYHFETSMLQRCEPGFVWSPTDSRACVFRFNNRCYDDEESVCACACPRNANSVCVLSGFLSDPNNPLMVSCTAR
ncbi:MAG TPA: hypothetical protein VFS67_23755 [Polyangiaceae bacterium]|nr:hypothetical protein [Polyangiaceae bacterium]